MSSARSVAAARRDDDAAATGRPGRALVIGGRSPIGAATASLLARGGTRVAIVRAGRGSDLAPLDGGTARDGATERSGIVELAGDAVHPATARALVGAAAEAIGGLDTLIRIDGTALRGAVGAVDPIAWSSDVDQALGGMFNVTIAAADALDGGGSVVHVLTVDALHAYPGRSALSAATAGSLGLIRSLALELAARGIRVNAVIAGPIEESVPSELDPESIERTRLRSPMGRLGRATEIAEAIRFVAGDGASFMTGQALRVDGGWAALNQAPDGMRFT